MTVATTEMASQVSQLGAGRDSEAASINAVRLDNWKRRYPHGLVEVPEPVDFGGWPPTCRTGDGFVLRNYPATNVTKIKRAGR
jgi:hypothetical protein